MPIPLGVSNPTHSTRKDSPSGFFVLVEAHSTSPELHTDGGVFHQNRGLEGSKSPRPGPQLAT